MSDRTRGPLTVDQVLEELALVLGGLAAQYDVPDAFVERLVEHLDGVRLRANGAVREAVPHRFRPHPAVERFLRELRRETAAGHAQGE